VSLSLAIAVASWVFPAPWKAGTPVQAESVELPQFQGEDGEAFACSTFDCVNSSLKVLSVYINQLYPLVHLYARGVSSTTWEPADYGQYGPLAFSPLIQISCSFTVDDIYGTGRIHMTCQPGGYQ